MGPGYLVLASFGRGRAGSMQEDDPTDVRSDPPVHVHKHEAYIQTTESGHERVERIISGNATTRIATGCPADCRGIITLPRPTAN